GPYELRNCLGVIGTRAAEHLLERSPFDVVVHRNACEPVLLLAQGERILDGVVEGTLLAPRSAVALEAPCRSRHAEQPLAGGIGPPLSPLRRGEARRLVIAAVAQVGSCPRQTLCPRSLQRACPIAVEVELLIQLDN